MQAELSVISKTYGLLLWTTHHVEGFPRSHRYSVGARLEQQVYQVLEKLVRAKFRRDRAALLAEVNLDLEVLRFQFRLASDLKCLSLKSHGFSASGSRYGNGPQSELQPPATCRWLARCLFIQIAFWIVISPHDQDSSMMPTCPP